jgi:GntR family transcriptional regulator, transcriptional repressor for pyruvate dehydrogenase complex
MPAKQTRSPAGRTRAAAEPPETVALQLGKPRRIRQEPDAEEAVVQFARVTEARAFEEVARQIRHELTEGRLKVGSRLPSERTMAEQMGVSRHVLREALRSLENAGLIRIRKGAAGGAFVAAGGGSSIAAGMLDLYHLGAITPEQLTQARIWIGGIIVREACRKATAADIAEIDANIHALEVAISNGSHEQRVEINFQFHRLLARIAANPILMIVTNAMLSIVADFVRSLGEYDSRFVLPSRRSFLKKFAAGNAEEAAKELEESITRLYRTYLKHARTHQVSSRLLK